MAHGPLDQDERSADEVFSVAWYHAGVSVLRDARLTTFRTYMSGKTCQNECRICALKPQHLTGRFPVRGVLDEIERFDLAINDLMVRPWAA